ARSFPFSLSVHRLAVNTGVAVGMNWGIVQGRNELVARLDDDVRVPPHWLERLVEVFRDRPFAGVVGPKIVNDNATHDVQCGPYRLFPSLYGHDGEPDTGQADYRARAVHVRGCCNVYRRDALAECGLLDIRFSPTQYDDPDHHVAMQAAGYEVVYEGHVAVVHALTNGAARSWAAMSNQQANQAKLLGKWGAEVWATLDRAIDLSREGRYLPDEGEPELGDAPDPSSFPRVPNDETRDASRKAVELALRYREMAARPDGPLREYFDDSIAFARSARRDGRNADAAAILHSVVDLAPLRVDALLELASTYEDLGQPERAALLESRARHLDPEARRAPAGAKVTAERSSEIGEVSCAPALPRAEGRLRALIVNTFERRVPGGDMHQIRKTKEHLESLGVHVDVSCSPRPDPRGYDVVHVFNLWFPHQTLPQVKAIRSLAPDVPIALTPIFWDMSEKAWADRAVPALFAASTTPEELRARLAELASGSLRYDGRTRSERQEPNFVGYEEYQRQILKRVNHLLPQSELEVRNLETTLGAKAPPFTIVRNAAERGVFDRASADDFVKAHGLRDFVLTVGLVEPRKNQLMLLHALRSTRLPAVVVGRNYDRNYLRLCREAAPPRTLFLEHLPHEQLASALKAACVFALPSWLECASFASIEAALAGCPLVVGDRTSEPEYFGDDAYLCDPASADSIRDAVLLAHARRDPDASKRERLQRRFRDEWTWRRAAEATLEGYEAAIEARAPLTSDHNVSSKYTSAVS
ncbi:MAG TPA: glycosyltransferase, partial [Planctomycetota bacterium]|nr:glycosyltransferase [Planctomycetota bacterium]